MDEKIYSFSGFGFECGVMSSICRKLFLPFVLVIGLLFYVKTQPFIHANSTSEVLRMVLFLVRFEDEAVGVLRQANGTLFYNDLPVKANPTLFSLSGNERLTTPAYTFFHDLFHRIDLSFLLRRTRKSP